MRDKYIFSRRIKLLLLLGLAIFLLNSCKKDQTNSNAYSYFMKFDVDGKTIEFTTQASLVAAFSSSGTTVKQYNALFTGYNSNSNMGLQIFDGNAITTGTYTGYTIVNSAVVGVLIGYQDTSGTLYTQGTTNSDAVITISEMTTSTVKGTFSGTLKATGKSDISVTNGQFYVWRAN